MLETNIKNVRYVPHSVDTKIYKPHSAKSDKETRKRLGIPEDVFLVGIVAANKGFPARKGWPQMLEAMKYFMERHKDVYLYAHTLATTEDQGVDIPGIAQRFGIGDRLVIPNPYLYLQGFPPKEMSKIYSCFDTFLLPSHGEGFGVPIIESQACGTPVIVTDFSAMPELVAPTTGALVNVAYKWYTPLYSYQALPDIQDMVDKLEYYYQMDKIERKRQSQVARDFIVGNYDADLVAEKYWHPIVKELAKVTEKRILKVA